MNVPNLICVFRVLLAFYAFWNFAQAGDKLVFFVLTVLVIVLDAADGYAARKLNQATEFGAKFDIICDRIVELAYWLFFAYVNLIHIWVFLFFLVRGLLVDYLSRKSDRPLGDSFLRSSRFMRGAYGFAKLARFSILILVPSTTISSFIILPEVFSILTNTAIAHIVSYITVVLCFLRALPVLQDQFRK